MYAGISNKKGLDPLDCHGRDSPHLLITISCRNANRNLSIIVPLYIKSRKSGLNSMFDKGFSGTNGKTFEAQQSSR